MLTCCGLSVLKKPLPEAEEVLCDNYLAASIKLERLKMVWTIG